MPTSTRSAAWPAPDSVKATYSLAIAIILVALPVLGLISPSFTYQPRVGPYGSFVDTAATLLTLSRYAAFTLAIISLALIARWKSAAIHAAIYMVAALVLVAAGTPIARITEANSRQDVMAFYASLKPGQEQGAIERNTMAAKNFSSSPLNLGEHDRLAGFPVDGEAGAAMIIKSHGTRASVALWFRPGRDGEEPTLSRKAFLDNRTIQAIAPPLADREDRVLVGVLSSSGEQMTFTPCNTDTAYPVTTDRAPEPAKALIGGPVDGQKRNAILIGRIAAMPSHRQVIDVRGWRTTGRWGTYDQSFYDSCQLQLR